MTRMLKLALGAAALPLAIAATPVGAVVIPNSLVSNGTACSAGDITPGALTCAGFYEGNLLNNGQRDGISNIVNQQVALATLGFNWDGNFNAVEKISGLGGSTSVNFAQMLNGITYLGFHFGNGQGGPGEGTAFYQLNASNLDILTLRYQASSDAVLYSTGSALPEPGTWAMMILGIGAIGVAMRRRLQSARFGWA